MPRVDQSQDGRSGGLGCVGFLGAAQRGSHTPPRPGATTKAAWDGGRDGAWRRLAAVGLPRSVCASLLSGVREKKPPRLQSCQKRRRPLLPSEPVSRTALCLCVRAHTAGPAAQTEREGAPREERAWRRALRQPQAHARPRTPVPHTSSSRLPHFYSRAPLSPLCAQGVWQLLFRSERRAR